MSEKAPRTFEEYDTDKNLPQWNSTGAEFGAGSIRKHAANAWKASRNAALLDVTDALHAMHGSNIQGSSHDLYDAAEMVAKMAEEEA